MKKKFIICIFLGLIVGLVMLNKWIQGEVGEIVERPVNTATVEVQPPAAQKVETPKPKKRTGEIIRKTRLGPQRTFETSIFYQGGEEIARHKVSRKGMIYDQTGEIPNGKVKFINETDQTYGVEYYRGGVRSGPARTNYKDGSLKYKTDYQYGRLMTQQEYYHDGTLKMEQDYTDAREYDDGRDVGIGKVYSRDGRIKYEWYLVNSDPSGYYKSYDRNGNLTAVIHYDKDGAVVNLLGNTTIKTVVSESSL